MTDTSLIARLDCGAIFSDCGQYRYFLRRDHTMGNPRPLLWVMLNPSKAGQFNDDPTTTLAMNFGKSWGFGIHAAVNCFAMVGTDPRCLNRDTDPIGPDNDIYIRTALDWCDSMSGRIILAWGAGGNLNGRAGDMLKLLGKRTVWRLGQNADGSPRFPRAIAKATQPQEWRLP